MLISKVSKNLLEELKQVISQLDSADYSKPLELLSGNTIGQHCRHIIEFYQCFIEGNLAKEIDYDLRKRNTQIETDTDFTCQMIENINSSIGNISNKNILLKFSNDDEVQYIESSLERELVYNIEHTIHHMAIIKIAIISNFKKVSLPENFGVAYSTIKYNQQNVHS